MTENPTPLAEEQLNSIKEMLKSEQHRDRFHHSAELVSELVHRVLEHKREMVTSTVARSREFQQDVLTFLRAFELMLETVAGASTHGEKAARLRGLMELVGTAARKVREKQFSETQMWSYALSDDVFRSDYPVRHFIDKSREAERKVKILEDELATLRGGKPGQNVMTKEDAEAVPF